MLSVYQYILYEVDMKSMRMNCSGTDKQQMFSASRLTRPVTKLNLKNYVKSYLGLNVPDKKICPNHCAPIDYLWHAFSCDFMFSE